MRHASPSFSTVLAVPIQEQRHCCTEILSREYIPPESFQRFNVSAAVAAGLGLRFRSFSIVVIDILPRPTQLIHNNLNSGIHTIPHDQFPHTARLNFIVGGHLPRSARWIKTSEMAVVCTMTDLFPIFFLCENQHGAPDSIYVTTSPQKTACQACCQIRLKFVTFICRSREILTLFASNYIKLRCQKPDQRSWTYITFRPTL